MSDDLLEPGETGDDATDHVCDERCDVDRHWIGVPETRRWIAVPETSDTPSEDPPA